MIGFGLLVIIIAGLSGFSIYSARDTLDIFETAVRMKGHEGLNERADKQIAEGSMAIWLALAMDDQSRWEQADEALNCAAQRLDELLVPTTDPKRLAEVKALKAQVADYALKAAKLKPFNRKNGALATPEGKAIVAEAMAAVAKIHTIAAPLAEVKSGPNWINGIEMR